jgi:hypothetical protein
MAENLRPHSSHLHLRRRNPALTAEFQAPFYNPYGRGCVWAIA